MIPIPEEKSEVNSSSGGGNLAEEQDLKEPEEVDNSGEAL